MDKEDYIFWNVHCVAKHFGLLFVKVKLALEEVMKAQTVSRGIALLFLSPRR
jgi:hypothetical protein